MKIPYNRVHVNGNVVFAARGGKIHAFKLSDGGFISTWKHPGLENLTQKVPGSTETQPEAEDSIADAAPASSPADQNEPPTKRQKVDADKDANGNQKGNKHHRGNDSRFGSVPDRPVVSQITTTPDGSYVIAVSGHDKAIWVFEHDGEGHLTLLSKRAMPKRPSSLVISPDSQIICADKFGDVYALPLLDTGVTSTTSFTRASKPVFVKPAATPLTVHSKGNLQALANQHRQVELANQGKDHHSQRAEEPTFQLSLLLGHVSMLTAVILAENGSRKYIVTSDRDEHIRVTRYIPQTHIIQSYCLGHKDFVGDITIPEFKKNVLVSGGGDEDLLVWDWEDGKLLSRTSILAMAKEVFPDISNVAVSGLYSIQCPSESESLTYILAICEGVSAIFTWQLTEDNELKYPGIIQLPGKPLHLSVCPQKDNSSLPTIITALHIPEGTQAKSLHVFTLTLSDGRLAVDTDKTVQDDGLETSEADIADTEVRSLYYTVENLRKTSGSGGDAAGQDEKAEAE